MIVDAGDRAIWTTRSRLACQCALSRLLSPTPRSDIAVLAWTHVPMHRTFALFCRCGVIVPLGSWHTWLSSASRPRDRVSGVWDKGGFADPMPTTLYNLGQTFVYGTIVAAVTRGYTQVAQVHR